MPGDAPATRYSRTRKASAVGAQAIGTSALGGLTLGATLLGATAAGAIAVGALVISRLSVGRARFKRVEIDELAIGRIDASPRWRQPGVLTAITRIRAAPGKGDEMADVLLQQTQAADADDPGVILHPPQRSMGDPDLFLLYEQYADEAAFSRLARPRFRALGQSLVGLALIAGPADEVIEMELFRAA